MGVREVEAEDIGTGVYSIEEDKQKTEQENKLKMALQKKEKLKKRVVLIQKDLAELMKANREHESNERLPLEDFEIDPSLRRYPIIKVYYFLINLPNSHVLQLNKIHYVDH